MRCLLLLISILLLTLNGCYVYQDTYSWKLAPKTCIYENGKLDFELSRPDKTLMFPFLITIFNKRKERFSPYFGFISTVDSIKTIANLDYTIYSADGKILVSDSINNIATGFYYSIYNNNNGKSFFVDTLANTVTFFKSKMDKNYTIKGLREKSEGDYLMLDIALTIIYDKGYRETISFKEKKITKTRFKDFGSFF